MALWATTAAPLAGERFSGVSALAGSYSALTGHLIVSRSSGTAARIDFWEQRGATTVRDYDVDMTKRLHLIVVPLDFSSFQHLHPALDALGHFHLALAVPAGGAYEIYADTVPHGDPQTVFRFSVPFGPAKPSATTQPLKGNVARAGPYVVTLERRGLVAEHETQVVARITRDGRPARDLRSYLGAAAHVVLIDTHTLSYVHVHPDVDGPPANGESMEAMPGMAAMRALAPNAHVAATMNLHVRAPAPGSYRMWLQFRGGNGLNVAPFSLNTANAPNAASKNAGPAPPHK